MACHVNHWIQPTLDLICADHTQYKHAVSLCTLVAKTGREAFSTSKRRAAARRKPSPATRQDVLSARDSISSCRTGAVSGGTLTVIRCMVGLPSGAGDPRTLHTYEAGPPRGPAETSQMRAVLRMQTSATCNEHSEHHACLAVFCKMMRFSSQVIDAVCS